MRETLALIVCPTCQFQLGIERRGDEIVLTYDVDDWTARCTSPYGDPALCDEFRPILADLLTNGKIVPGTGKPAKK